jgi:NitT/TauT family transport system substrate-binding protein
MRLGTFVVAASLLVAGPALAQDKASLRLNWLLSGSHGAFVLGNERGYYKAEGIDLTLNEGRGSARSVQQIGSKDDDFAMADAGSLIAGASKGIPARSVMSLVNRSTFGVIARADLGIKTMKDLEGKRLAVTAGDGLTQLWPAVVTANKLDGDKVRLVMMDATAKTTSFLDKQVDAVLGGITEFPTLFKAKGVDSVVLAFADYGVNTIGMTVIAHNDTIKAKPDLVKRFVRATQKSYEAMIAEPKEAAASVNRMNKDLPLETLVKTVEEINLVTVAGIPKGKRIGLAEDAEWQLTLDLMKKYREVETNQPATAFYTNEFLSN